VPVIGVAADEPGGRGCSRRTEEIGRLDTGRLLTWPGAATGVTGVAVRFLERFRPPLSASTRVRRTAGSACARNALRGAPPAERAPPGRRRGHASADRAWPTMATIVWTGNHVARVITTEPPQPSGKSCKPYTGTTPSRADHAAVAHAVTRLRHASQRCPPERRQQAQRRQKNVP
jgi:hypothetical protein